MVALRLPPEQFETRGTELILGAAEFIIMRSGQSQYSGMPVFADRGKVHGIGSRAIVPTAKCF